MYFVCRMRSAGLCGQNPVSVFLFSGAIDEVNHFPSHELDQPHLKLPGLTFAQHLTLLTPLKQGGIMVSDLGQRQDTISHLLKQVELGGFINRVGSIGQDEHRVIILLIKADRTGES